MATITDKTVNNMAATEPIADEKASASGRLITITIIMLIGLFIIYIYHEYLKPSRDRALAKYERVHKVAETYKRKKDNGESIPDYDVDELQQSLNKVKNILTDELKIAPTDSMLLAAMGNINDDLDMFNLTVKPTE